MDVFALLFILSFIALIVTLVVMSIRKSMNKGEGDFKVKNTPHQDICEILKEHDKLTKLVCVNPDPFIIRVSEPHYKDIESEMKREVNETQEKWKETVPKHSTRIKLRASRKLRNKRKGKKK